VVLVAGAGIVALVIRPVAVQGPNLVALAATPRALDSITGGRPGAPPASTRSPATGISGSPSAAIARAAAPRTGGSADSPGSSGMVVAIDPETGALGMPSPEQSRALVSPGSATLSRLLEGVVEIQGQAGAA